MGREPAWLEKHRMRRGYSGSTPVMYCRACRGAGSSLATHCPGRMLTDAEEAAITERQLDFVNGEWLAATPE